MGASLSAPSGVEYSASLRAARLDEFESQAVFRCLLDSLARPGTVFQLPHVRAEGVPPALLPLLALADVDVSIAVGEGESLQGWGALAAAATDAPTVPLDRAAIVVLLGGVEPDIVRSLQRGDAFHPEAGAKAVFACRAIRASSPSDDRHSPDATMLTVSGPGVDGSRCLAIDGVAAAAFQALAAVNAVHPGGVDVWLVADDGTTVGLPRSATLATGTATTSTPTTGDTNHERSD